MFVLLLLSTPAIVAASWLLHLAFERPFMANAPWANPGRLAA